MQDFIHLIYGDTVFQNQLNLQNSIGRIIHISIDMTLFQFALVSS